MRRCNCCGTGPWASCTWPRDFVSSAAVHRHTPDEPVPPGVNWDLFSGRRRCAVQQEPARVQLALVLEHRQRRHRQPGHSRDGHRAMGLGVGLAEGRWFDRRQVRLRRRPGDTEHADGEVDYGDAEICSKCAACPPEAKPTSKPAVRISSATSSMAKKDSWRVDHTGFRIFLGEKREPGESISRTTDGRRNGGALREFHRCHQEPPSTKICTATWRSAPDSAILVHIANDSYRSGRQAEVRSEDAVVPRG